MTKSLEALIAEIKLSLKSVTPGQWYFARSGANANVQAQVNLQRGGAARVVLCGLKRSQWRNQLATAHDAAFIALANPENIDCLIAALEQAQQQNRELIDERTASMNEMARIIQRESKLRREAEKRIAELEAATPIYQYRIRNYYNGQVSAWHTINRDQVDLILKAQPLNAEFQIIRAAGGTVAGSD